jgi:hypothetical protein
MNLQAIGSVGRSFEKLIYFHKLFLLFPLVAEKITKYNISGININLKINDYGQLEKFNGNTKTLGMQRCRKFIEIEWD